LIPSLNPFEIFDNHFNLSRVPVLPREVSLSFALCPLLDDAIKIETMSPTDPVDLIFTGLRIKRSKAKIKEKLLELGLARDRKELRKKRARKSNQGEYTLFVLPSSSRSGLKHPLFRPIPSHSIRICLSYYPPIPRLFPFDQSSSNAIAGDCIERLAFSGGSETARK